MAHTFVRDMFSGQIPCILLSTWAISAVELVNAEISMAWARTGNALTAWRNGAATTDTLDALPAADFQPCLCTEGQEVEHM